MIFSSVCDDDGASLSYELSDDDGGTLHLPIQPAVPSFLDFGNFRHLIVQVNL